LTLRRGTVPANGLDLLAVGLDRFTPALDADLGVVADGGAAFKAVRGEYGADKTFLTRYLAERALRQGFAAAEVQISETETPLHKLETVYRRITESLRTASFPPSAFRPVLDSWLLTLESDAVATDPGLAERQSNEEDRGLDGVHELAGGVPPTAAAREAQGRRRQQHHYDRRTKHRQIAALYDRLADFLPSPVVELNRAVAIAMAGSPAAGLAIIDSLAQSRSLPDYHLLPAVRADLLRRLHRFDEAAGYYREALGLARTDSERRFLQRRLHESETPGGPSCT